MLKSVKFLSAAAGSKHLDCSSTCAKKLALDGVLVINLSESDRLDRASLAFFAKL